MAQKTLAGDARLAVGDEAFMDDEAEFEMCAPPPDEPQNELRPRP